LRRSEFKFTSRILEPLSADSVVYDLGAGESHFSELFNRFKRVIPVDIFPYPKVVIVADFTKEVPLRNDSGDILVLSNVLEHIAEPQLFLKEGNRVLKSGGTIVGTIPFMLGVHQAPYDYNRFTDYMLKHLLTGAGFIDVEIQTLSTPYNTYTSMTGNFFKVVGTYLATHGTRFDKLKFRLARKLHSITMNRFRSFFASVPPASEFALGYGFTARKK
jgi:SAM-dependent methyltransferase